LREAYHGRESDMDSIVSEIFEAVASVPPLTASRLLHTLFDRDVLRSRFLDQMDRYPILLCPVNAVPAFRHGERSWDVEGQTVGYLDASSYSQCFNLLGNPAAVVPVDRSPEGLPIGVQIVGRPWEEERVLAVAAILDETIQGYRLPLMEDLSE
jgi:Asp-tRNA(Asn)/Glu-tRNA(Gln) amidotransferase A subunit family amidase